MHKRKTRPTNQAIKDESWNAKFEKEDIKQKWVEDIEDFLKMVEKVSGKRRRDHIVK